MGESEGNKEKEMYIRWLLVVKKQTFESIGDHVIITLFLARYLGRYVVPCLYPHNIPVFIGVLEMVQAGHSSGCNFVSIYICT